MKNINNLIKEVEYAYNNVPFYHKLLNELSIKPSSINDFASFSVLPFTAKVDYRKHFPKGVLAEGFHPAHPMITSSRSSGSTGERLITIEIGMYLLQRAISCAEINENILSAFSKMGRKIARYAAPNCSDVECANPNSQIEDRLLADNTLVLPVYHDLMTTPHEMLIRTMDEIDEFKPDLFYVDPTHFAFLLRAYKKAGRRPPNIPVMVAYTGATRVSKRQIAEFYDMSTHYAELLSSTEFGWVAMECPHGHLHVNDDSFFFEYLPTDAVQSEDTQYRELCISSIDQGASPHLRYRTGDIVTMVEGQCECGSDRQRIIMDGKVSHFLTIDDQPVLSPQQIDALVGGPQWLDVYQLEQVNEEQYLFKMVVNDNYQKGDEQEFINKLAGALKRKISVDASVVDYIASERSGKFQFVRGMNHNV